MNKEKVCKQLTNKTANNTYNETCSAVYTFNNLSHVCFEWSSWLHVFQSYFTGIEFWLLGVTLRRNHQKIQRLMRY